MPLYPNQIDNSTSLPITVDNSTPVEADVVNRLRDAIISVESELGIKPSGINGNVRTRIENLETVISTVSSNAVFLGKDLGGTFSQPVVIGLQGRPLSFTAPTIGQGLIWNGSNWAPSDIASSFIAAGDLSGSATNQVVIGLQGNPVSNSVPSLNQVLTWDGSIWAAADIGSSGFVAGGDLSGSSTNQVVIKINNTSVPASPSASQVLVATNSTTSIWSQIHDGYVATNAAIAGTKINPSFGSQNISLTGKITTTGILAPATSSSGTGIIYFDSTSNKFKISENTSSYSTLILSSTSSGGDISGTFSSLTVNKINSASVPAAGSLTTNHVLKVSGSSSLTYGFISDSNISSSAAIAGTKISPDFGSQNIQTTGNIVSPLYYVGTSSGPSVTSGSGSPSSSPNAGSIFLRTDGTSSTGVYTYQSGSWSAIGGGSATPTGTGFVHITSGSQDSAAKLVVNADVSAIAAIDGSKIVPAFSSQNISLTGKITTTGISAPSTAASGTGIIYFDNTANKFKISESTASYATIILSSTTSSGDTSGTFSTITVNKINGTSVPSTPSANQVLVATGSSAAIWSQIYDGYVASSAAIAGTKISPNFGSQVVQTTGNLISPTHFVGTSSGPSITSGTGIPSSTPNAGSIFLRTDGTGSTGIYTYQSSAWTAVGGGGGGSTPSGTGFVHITSGSQDSAAKLVEDADVSSSAAIAGTKIAPAFGSQDLSFTGKTVVTGISAPSASSSGTGIIYFDSGANKFKVSESTASYATIVLSTTSAGGDVSGTFSSLTVTKANGTAIPSGPSTNQVLVATGTTTSVWSQIYDGYVASAAAIAGTKISPAFGSQNLSFTGKVVVTGISAPSTSSSGTGIIYFDSGTNNFKISESTGSYATIVLSSTAAGGDVSGTFSSLTVTKANGTTIPATPSANQVLVATGTSIAVWSQIYDGYVASAAAIAGTKISPDFGSQAVKTTGIVRMGADAGTGITVFGSTSLPASGDSLYSYSASASNTHRIISGLASGRAVSEILNSSAGSSTTVGIRLIAAGASDGTAAFDSNGTIEQIGSSTSSIVLSKILGDGTSRGTIGRIYQSGAWGIGDSSTNNTSSGAQAGITGAIINIASSSGTLTSASNQMTLSNNSGDGYVQAHSTVRIRINATDILKVDSTGPTANTYVVGSTGGPTFTSGTGVPASAPPQGSIYMRTDGTSAAGLYTYQSGSWVALGAAGAAPATSWSRYFLAMGA